MEYRIKSIKPKSTYIRNKYYPAMIGRECDITHLGVGWHGHLVVDMAYDPGNPHRFCTTPVKKIENLDNGTIVFETENSVYTLTRIEEGE